MIDKVGREIEGAEMNCWWREKIGDLLRWEGRRHGALVEAATVEAIESQNR